MNIPLRAESTLISVLPNDVYVAYVTRYGGHCVSQVAPRLTFRTRTFKE